MAQRVIPLHIRNEYILGDGLVIGSAGSHDDVLLEISFLTQNSPWEGTTRVATFRNALGEDPVNRILTMDMLVGKEEDVYLVPIPNSTKAIDGEITLTVRGVVVENGVEKMRIATEAAKFRVLPSGMHDFDGETDVPASAAEQLQHQIDTLKSDLIAQADRAEAAKQDAEAARDEAQTAESGAKEAQSKAEVAQGKAEDAQAGAESAKDNAEEALSKAKEAQTKAETARTGAETAQNAAEDSASRAAASQEAAARSEANAKTSESNAKTSETNAKTSETNAKTSEGKAKTSENNAKDSETNAKTSESNAKTSETKAKASEDEAKRLAETFDTEALYARIKSKGDNLEFDTETSLLWLTSDGKRVGDGIKVSDDDVTAENIVAALGYTPADAGAVPTKTSQLTNDSRFITKAVTDLTNYYLKSETLTKTEINAIVSAIPKFSIQVVTALPTSGISATTVYLVKDGADGNLYTEYIYVGGAWEILGSQRVDLTGYATEVFVQNYAQPKGNYALKEEVEKLSNEKADQTEVDDLTAEVDDLKANGVQQVPLFANRVEECTDTSKVYVLPDGFIYAYKFVEATGPSYTNLSETVHENFRMGSGGTLSALAGAVTTDFIPVRKGQTVRFKGFNPLVMPSGKYPYIVFYTGADQSDVLTANTSDRFDYLKDEGGLTQDSNGVWTYTAFMATQSAGGSSSGNLSQHKLADSITHIRMCGTMIDGETVIVTVDEEITEGGSAGGYQWVNTGHAFVPADYEERILDLEAHAEAIPESRIKAIENALDEPNPADYSGNILYGKKWVACGDSLTAGGYNASDGFDESVYIYQDGRFAGQKKVYPFMIGLRNNMEIVNLATGGQSMAASSNSFMTRYQSIDADADYITIYLGGNDEGTYGIPVGSLEDSTNATFCGAYNIAMEHILENHPFAHVGIVVSNHTNAEYMEATRKMAERWGVPCLDLGSPNVPLMNRYTGRNVCAKAQEIREKNFNVKVDADGNVVNAHPNTAAHEYFSTFFEAWLRTL